MEKRKKKEKTTLAKNIIERRNKLGWSAEKLAEKAEVSYPTIRDIEAGVSNGWQQTREKIADALGCSVGDLHKASALDSNQAPDLTAAADLLQKFVGLPPDLQKIALTVIHQDTAYLKGIPPKRAQEMADAIADLFRPLQRAGQK